MDMTTTQIATTNHIGTCRRNRAHRFVAANRAEMGVACPTCGTVKRVGLTGEMQTIGSGIVWKAVQGRVSTKKCTGSCLAAASVACSCQCGGHNHGKALGQAA